MILKNEDDFEKFAAFDDVFSDGRMAFPGKSVCNIRGAIDLQKKLNRPLTEEEMKQFE